MPSRSLLLLRPASGVPPLAAILALSACGKPSQATAALADVTVGEHGFTPSSFKLAVGGPGSHATVSFVRTTDQTCATEVVFPELDIKKALPLNQPVKFDVPTDVAKTLTFQCGMAMYKGAVVVNAQK